MAFMQFEKDEVRFIMSHDPGGTTGMAFAEYDEKEVRITVIGHIPDGRQGYLYAFDGMQFGWPTNKDIVSEQWVERNIPGADREPIYIEGVQYALWQENVHYQTPDMKALVPDEKLKELGIWRENMRHAMDAVIHLLVWLRNQGHKPTIEALSEDGDPSGIKMPAPNGEPGGQGDQPDENGSGEDQQQGGQGGQQTEGDEQQGGAGEPKSAAQQAIENLMQQVAQSVEDADPTGPGGNGGDWVYDLTVEVKGKRSERELNGAFTGYNPEAEGGTVMYDQKF